MTDRAASAELSRVLADAQAWIEAELSALVQHCRAAGTPALLADAMEYALVGGGKRLRPALVRLIGGALGAAALDLRGPALAIELVHTYSLVHDDLPCMDDDDLRRGRPTVHRAFDEATAVLVGDALLTLAFEEVVRGSPARAGELVGALARAAGASGMVGGQVLDLTLPAELGPEALADMHARKTGALFGAAAELGALAAKAERGQCERARAFGLALGRAFQATDDLLDVTGSRASLGKTPGKDAAHGRTTLVTLLGLERARAEAERQAEEARQAARALGAEPRLFLALVDGVLGREG